MRRDHQALTFSASRGCPAGQVPPLGGIGCSNALIAYQPHLCAWRRDLPCV